MNAFIKTRILSGFEDPSFGAPEWNRLLATAHSDFVFLTWEWQSTWWDTLGRGRLLLVLAERNGQTVALAPFFTEAGIIYFVGSGGSDYLDFVGDISEAEILDGLLVKARDSVQNFVGFVFYHVPDSSSSGHHLKTAATRLGLNIFDEGDQLAPLLEFSSDKANALKAAHKKSLVRHEKFFTRDGLLEVQHLRTRAEILTHIDEFFEQHCERWSGTSSQSLFKDDVQRRFYRLLTERAADTGWLELTRLEWRGRAIAFHFGFCHRGNFMWYKPSFAIDLSRHSPGEVLLRQLLLTAIVEGVHTFDFGLGDEAFKARFATRVNRVRNWGLYDAGALALRAICKPAT